MRQSSRNRLIMLLVFLCGVTMTPLHVNAQDATGDAPIVKDDEEAPVVDHSMESKTPDEIDENTLAQRARDRRMAEKLIFEGREARINGDYEVAIEKFTRAEELLKSVSKSSPSVVAQQSELTDLISATYVAWGDFLVAEGDAARSSEKFDMASSKFSQALQKDPGLVDSISEKMRELSELQKRAELAENLAPLVVDPELEPRNKRIFMAIERGKVFMKHGRYLRAREQFEIALMADPSNREATRQLDLVYRQLHEDAQARRWAMLRDKFAEVEWKWIDPIPPTEITGPGAGGGGVDAVPKASGDVQRKLKEIRLPKIKFDEAPVSDVIRYLKERSAQLDVVNGTGINIFLINKTTNSGGEGGGPEAIEAPAVDDFSIDDFDEISTPDDLSGSVPAPAQATSQGSVITMEFDDIPLGEAIRYLCQGANPKLSYKVEENAVVIYPEGEKIEAFETRFYSVPPGVFYGGDTREEATGVFGGGDDDDDDDDDDDSTGREADNILERFTQLGVVFPPGSQISYASQVSKLVVTNTADELRKVERILDELIKQPSQITIEAKFVEVRQTTLKELGFDWGFNGTSDGGDVHLGNSGGPFDLFVAPNDGTTLLSSGISHIGASGPNLLFGGIIGNIQLSSLLYAFNTKDGLDVLSAPKITTISGQTANVQLVERRRLVESFTEPEFVTSDGGQTSFSPPSPELGEEQRFGVQLTVTPTVGDDEYTIDLELRPTVTQFLGYDRSLDSVAFVNGQQVTLPFPVAIISERSIETRVLVYDGETVVLGGTITDSITKNDDKVPYLSDIPLVGKLFTSKGEQSEKNNLLIFVSARLVRPNGLPKRPSEIRGLPDFRR